MPFGVGWAAAAAKDKGRLQRVIHSAEKVIGSKSPCLGVLLLTPPTLKTTYRSHNREPSPVETQKQF